MKIGLIPPHWTGSMAENTPSAQDVISFRPSAERAGLDSLWLTDHLHHEPYLDFLEHGYQLPEEHKGTKRHSRSSHHSDHY